MSFVFNPALRLSSPHKDGIIDIVLQNKTNQMALLSPSSISVWSFAESDPKLLGSVSAGDKYKFCKCAFMDENRLAFVTTTDKMFYIEMGSFNISKECLEIPKMNIVFMKRVSKHLFVLGNDGKIIYVSLNMSRFKVRDVEMNDIIVDAKTAGDSLYLLLNNGQIGVMHQNEFTYINTPSCQKFVIDSVGEYIQLYTHDEWQLWSLKPLSYISKLSLKANFGVWSPIKPTCAFFDDSAMVVAHYSSILERHNIGKSTIAMFDVYGQSLIFACESDIYLIGFASASSVLSTSVSAPITSRAVLLPFKEMMYSLPLPKETRGKIAVFGEAALAVGTENGICVLPFSEKICPSVSDGSAHSQFIKNASLLNEKEMPGWLVMRGCSVRALAWCGPRLVALCFSREFRINVISFSKKSLKLEHSLLVSGRPLSISVYGNKLVVAFASQLSFYSLDGDLRLVSTSSFGEITIKSAAFLNSETVAVHTTDRRLFLIFHSNVLRIFDDVTGFQLTGSNAWPLFLYGEKWRLLGANNAELVLDTDMQRGLIIGVDGFSLFSVAPFDFIDFVHLVVFQSLSSDSLASAVSILSQSSKSRRVEILTKVGIASAESEFKKFVGLLDRFPDVEDSVLCTIFEKVNVNVDYREFWHNCFAHGWYQTAAELLGKVDSQACVDLLVKSEFNVHVVKSAAKLFPELLNPQDDVITTEDPLKWKLDDEMTRFFRTKFSQKDFLAITEPLQYLENGFKRFMLKSRREREVGIGNFNHVIDAMKKCTRQQLIQFSLILNDVPGIDLLFCCSYVLKDFATCIECIEKQQRIMKFIDSEILLAIGYYK